DGDLVSVILNATSAPDPSGGYSVVATVKDVTDRATAQADREELIRNLSTERTQLGRVLQRMARIQRFTASIAPLITEDQILEMLMEAAIEAVSGTAGAILLLGADGLLSSAIRLGDPDPAIVPSSSSPEGPGDLEEAFRTGASRWLEARPGRSGADERWGFVPIVGPGGAIGVLALSSPEVGLSSDDRDTVETMVRQAAQSLERARLYAAESRMRVTLTRVLTVSDAALEWME